MHKASNASAPTAAERALMSVPEAQAYLGGLGLTKTYALVNAGEIVKVNIGRRGFITRESLVAYVDRLVSGAA